MLLLDHKILYSSIVVVVVVVVVIVVIVVVVVVDVVLVDDVVINFKLPCLPPVVDEVSWPKGPVDPTFIEVPCRTACPTSKDS